MQLNAISFFLGILILMQFQFLPSQWYLCLIPLILFLLFSKRFIFLSFILFGFFWAWFRAELVLNDQLHPSLEGKAITVVGEILSLPEETSFGRRFVFDITEDIIHKKHSYTSPGKVRLSWWSPGIDLQPGQIWQCQVKLKRPVGFSNPGGFDYEFWLFHQGIRAYGYVKGHSCELQASSKFISMQNLRYHIRQYLSSSMSDQGTLALMLALLIGDRSLLSTEQWQVLQQTGTSHLLAISGLHIGLVFGLVLFCSRLLLRVSSRSLERMPVSRSSLYLGLLAAAFYAALAGFSLPTQRALIMLSISVVALLRYQSLSISKLISVSLVLILIIDPFAILTAGFWLSFMAVCIILFGMCYRVQAKGLWWQWGRVQYLITIALFPLVFFWFQVQAPLGFVANIIAIPIVSFAVVPFLLIYAVFINCLPQLAEASLRVSEAGLHLTWGYLVYLSQFKVLPLPLASPNVISTMLAMLGVVWFLLPRGFPAKYLSLIFLLPLFFSPAKRPEDDSIWLHVLDVGQGLAIVLQTADKVMVYDTGPKYSGEFNAGSAVIVPFLRQLGIQQIDKIVISHGDNDHIGGLNGVLASMPVKVVLSHQPLDKYASDVHHQPCNQQQSWQWENVTFEILHPYSMHDLSLLDRNQSSCVLKISAFDKSVLLTGDIDWKVEQQLLDKFAEQLESNILIVPHHGSLSSSSESFIRQVAPQYAIIASGYRNRFGFPKQVIIERYEKRDVTLLNTANNGMISFTLANDTLFYSAHRASHRRFWHTVQ